MTWTEVYRSTHTYTFNWFQIGDDSFQLSHHIILQCNGISSVCVFVRMQARCRCCCSCCLLLLLLFSFCFVPSSSELFSLLIWMTLISFWMSPKIWINGHVKHHKRMFDNTLMDKFYKHINYTIWSLCECIRDTFDCCCFGGSLCAARLSHFIWFAYKRFIIQRLLQVYFDILHNNLFLFLSQVAKCKITF